jgi:O-Antigen ligase
MHRALVVIGATVLLVGPAVLAFFAGGFFDGPRVVAAAIAWALVLLLAVAGPLPLPRSRAGQVAVAGLAGLAVWSAVSIAWAPLYDPAVETVQRLLLYLAVVLAAVAVLRDARVARWVEPVLAAGALAAIGYGLAGRLVPGIVDLIPARSFGAGGRLEQPITYWNAEGLLAAMGLILCVRIAGDGSRDARLRAAAAAACAPLGMGVYLSYSRGALAVACLGLIVLVATAPTWPQLRAAILGTAAALVAAASSALVPGVASLAGTAAERETDGAIMLTILLAVMLGAALASLLAGRAELGGPIGLRTPLPHARRLPVVAAAATGLWVAGLVIGGLGESAEGKEWPRAAPSRLASLTSLRYEYWRVGFQAFRDEPVRGVGAGGFRVEWREQRRVAAGATEVHSLELEMASELGIVGLVLLGLVFGGVAAAGRRALLQGGAIAPGACSVCVAWLLHASIDWDWQLPAVTLPALVLAAGLLAESERSLPGTAPADWVEERAHETEPVSLAAS